VRATVASASLWPCGRHPIPRAATCSSSGRTLLRW
jgi:hypothetical protein